MDSPSAFTVSTGCRSCFRIHTLCQALSVERSILWLAFFSKLGLNQQAPNWTRLLQYGYACIEHPPKRKKKEIPLPDVCCTC
jgi:hypothetical protein